MPPKSSQSTLFTLAERLGKRSDRFVADPNGWVEDKLAGRLWSKQREIALGLVEHKRVTVRSGHSTGKTGLAARIACWWIDTHPPGEAIVITTAPTFAQVSTIFWQEMRRVHTAGVLPGTITGDNRWTLDGGTLVALGRRPADWSPSSFQGYHRKYVLAIIDEAGGVPEWLWTSMETITTGDHCRILAIGNPDDPASHFAKTHDGRIPGWKSYRISCLETPAFTGEQFPRDITELLSQPAWVQDMADAWGEDSPLYQSKILGEFADTAENALIPLRWILAANERWQEWQEKQITQANEGIDTELDNATRGGLVLGVDVGGRGMDGDPSIICRRKGNVVLNFSEYKGFDTTQLTWQVMSELSATGSTAIIDAIGIGEGAYDQISRAGGSVVAFRGSEASRRRDVTNVMRFNNVRSDAWWHLRQALDPGLGAKLMLPPDDNLTADLIAPRWEQRGSRIVVEKKSDIKKRLGRSPDRGDALVMSCYDHVRELGSTGVYGNEPQVFSYASGWMPDGSRYESFAEQAAGVTFREGGVGRLYEVPDPPWLV